MAIACDLCGTMTGKIWKQERIPVFYGDNNVSFMLVDICNSCLHKITQVRYTKDSTYEYCRGNSYWKRRALAAQRDMETIVRRQDDGESFSTPCEFCYYEDEMYCPDDKLGKECFRWKGIPNDAKQ